MRTTTLFPALVLLSGTVLSKTLTYDCSSTPQICLNTCWAWYCAGHPKVLHGGLQSGKAANSGANRNKWEYSRNGWKIWQWGSNTSQDEYPLASSKEANDAQDGQTGGVYRSLRCVPPSEQQIQAGKTSGVGSASPGETIDFVLQNINKLPSGSPDWCAPYNRGSTTCKNDQHQVFFSAQGTFDLDAEDAQSKRDVQVTDVGNTKIIKVRNVAAPFTA
ncbi:hypothetical protein SCUP234_08947 [Seiridium cupressi]